DRGLDHLRMFNVSQFIVRSPEVKKKVALRPDLVREVTVGQYEIYREALRKRSRPLMTSSRGNWMNSTSLGMTPLRTFYQI
ncbi:MAG: hypothetical protein JSW05_13665, partial [Candidatus Thorarchaeota archaeon]